MAQKIKKGTTLTVLSLEDSEHDFEIICAVLTDGGFDLQIERVDTEKDFTAKLHSGTYDIILADFKLPRFNAFKALEIACKISPDIPFICISGTIGEETAVELIKCGAVDYILKDKPHRLPVAVQRALDEAVEKKKRKEAEDKLRQSEHNLIEAERLGKVGGWEFNIDTGKQIWTEEVYVIHEVDFTFEPTVANGIQFYSHASRPIVEAAVKKSIEDGVPFDVELEIITAKGNLRNVHAIGNVDLEHRRVFGFIQDITDRKRMEEALRESEERFRALVQWSPEAISVHRDGKVIFVNPAAIRMFGATSEKDLIGKSIIDLVHSDFHQDVEVQLKKKIDRGITIPIVEGKFIKLDGSMIDVEVQSISIIYNGELAVLGSMHDVTERKRAERELKKSEVRFRHISSTISDISYSCTINQDGSYLIDWMTGAVERITGYTIDEIKAKRCWGKLVAEEDASLFKELVTGLVPGSSGSCELRLKHKSGNIIWVASFAECVNDQEISESHILYGGLVDINERKLAEEVLQKSEEQYRMLFESINDAVLISQITDTGQTGKFIQVNDAACHRYGYTREELLSKTPLEINSDTSRHNVLPKLKNIIEKKQFIIEAEHVSKEGKVIPVEISTNITQFKDKTLFVSIARDITERKLAEKALQNKMDELQRFQHLTVGRELTMIELKKEVNELLKKNGQEGKYRIVE